MKGAMVFLLVPAALYIGYPTSWAQTNISNGKPNHNQIRERALKSMWEYEQNSQGFPKDKLLLAAQGFAIATNNGMAIRLCERLVTAEPEDALARRDLGFYLVTAQRYDEAAAHLKRGWILGDELSLKMLAIMYAHTKRYEALKPFISDLLKIRNTLPEINDRLQIVNVLILYGEHTSPGENVFLKAVDGLSDDLILEREDTAKLVIKGWLQMGQEDRVKRLIAKAEEKSARDDLSSKVRAYEQDPGRFADDELLPVGRGYFVEKKFGKAEELFTKFLTAEPTNTQAVRLLGSCYRFTGRYEEAAAQFKRGWALGDSLAYEYFADMFARLNRDNKDVRPFVSDALEIRDKVQDPNSKHNLVQALISHSLTLSPPDNRTVFFKAIDGLSDDFILERKATTESIIKGLEIFGEGNRAERLKEKAKR